MKYAQGGTEVNPVFVKAFQEAQALLGQFCVDEAAFGNLTELATRIAAAYQNGGKVLIAGNGGSMADAVHFAEELTGKFRGDRRPLPALALADPAHMSCVANDYGFDHVYSRMVQAFGGPQDVVILLSTSGNSTNLLAAASMARQQGCFLVGLLGRGGGALAPQCDLVVMVPGQTSDRIQELHMLCLHVLIEAVEKQLGLG